MSSLPDTDEETRPRAAGKQATGSETTGSQQVPNSEFVIAWHGAGAPYM